MYYVYVLRSLKTSELYYGYTSDLRKRLKEHNQGRNKSTKYSGPWQLVYYEAYLSQADAKEREYHLKRYGQARTHLKRRIKHCIATNKTF